MHGRKDNRERLREEAQQAKSRREIFFEQAMNKWAKVSDVGGTDLIELYAKNPKKAKRVAHAVEMQERFLSGKLFPMMEGTTISSDFAHNLRPETVLKTVYIGVANSKRGDIFHEMPLQSTDDKLIFLNAVFADTLRDATAGSKIYESTSKFYDGSVTDATVGTGNGSNLTFSATVTPNPLKPFNVRIEVAGVLVANDNGAGIISGAILDPASTNTVNYATGAIVLNFLTGNAPANGAVVKAVFAWDTEVSSNYTQFGTATLDITNTRWAARPMPLGYKYSDMTSIMFDTTGMGDFKNMMAKAVGDLHARQTDFRAIARAKAVAMSNPTETFDCDHATKGWVDGKAYAQFLYKKIGEINAKIFNQIQRGAFNKIVGGASAVNYLRLLNGWTPATGDFTSGVFQAGSVDGIEVFQCPADADKGLVADNELLLIYTNPDEALDLGLIWGVLIPQVSAELKYPQFYTEGYVASIEDEKLINGTFIRRLLLENLYA